MNFTVYKSSAGSGKTYTLVKEYLKLALQSDNVDDYRHILAITFTNKAASEMKERVLKSLVNIANQNPKEDQLLETIAKETNIAVDALRSKSEEVLKHILHHYADFSISTIDKFVHKIIRIFAFDLKLPLNFEVELDSKELLEKAIDELINKVGKDKKLTNILLKYTEEKADEEKSWHIENDIEHFAGNLLKDDNYIFIDQLKSLDIDDFLTIRKKISTITKAFEQKIMAYGEQALQLINNSGVDYSLFAGGATKGIVKYFEYLAGERIDKLTPNDQVLKTVNEDSWYSSKAKSPDKVLIDNIKDELTNIFNQVQQFIDDNYSEYVELKILNNNIYGLALLNEIEKVVNEIKAENNLLHISEFNKKIATIVLNEPAPFIYERIGEKYNNYLIDEFQDTSELQWQNLLPLIDNSLAGGHFNMVVGDGKQAIYRWRGGEVEQFSNLPYLSPKFVKNPVVREREDALVRNYNKVPLSTNFRSKSTIVFFNNKFFKEFATKLREEYQTIYEEIEQNIKEGNYGGYVSVELLQNDDKEAYKENTLNLIYQKIQLALSDNYQLKDIAILTRKNKEAITISNFLLERGIEVVSSESLLLASSNKVRTIVAALQYLQDDNKVEAQLQLIKHINELNNHKLSNELLVRLLKDKIEFKLYLLKNKIELNKELSGYSLLELLVRLSKMLCVNPKTDNFVSQFFEFAFKTIAKKSADIYSFLEEWEQKKDSLSIALAEGTNAVSIMTIHKSKGLQFPVVIFPYASWGIEQRDKKHWVQLSAKEIPELTVGLLNHKKDLESTLHHKVYSEENSKNLLDNINLLYVAFTRPEDRLHIIAPNDNRTLVKEYIDVLKKFEGWNNELFTLEIGQIERNTSSQKQAESKMMLKNDLPNKPVNDKVEVSFSYKEDWVEQKELSGKKYGLLVHRVLSKIKGIEDVQELSKFIKEERNLNENEKQQLENYIKQLFQVKEIKQLFEVNAGDKIFTEREILLENGEVIRPDRTVVNNKNVVIVDYKTGEKQEVYHKQLNEYASGLLSMGYEQVKKYLLYTDSKEVEAVI